MRILVTGGSGFIGSHFIDYAIKHGSVVMNIDKLTYAGSVKNNSNVINNPNYFFSQLDIVQTRNVAQLLTEFRPQAVVHFAAESHVDNSISDAANFLQTNIVGTYSLLEAVKGYLSNDKIENFKFIHVSTDEVFGALGQSGEFSEESPYRPNSPYSASKASSDMLVRAWQKTFNFPSIITNCSNNFGPRQHSEKLIPTVVSACKQRKPIPVYGNGENVRDWLYVTDHVLALWRILSSGSIGETYCIGGSNEISNIELIKKLCVIFEDVSKDGFRYQELITFIKDRKGHDYRYAIDGTKIRKKLGWEPSTNFDELLLYTVRSYL